MKKRSRLLSFSICTLVLMSTIISFDRCTKKTTTTVYKDTTIVVYRDTTILRDTTIDKQTYLLFLDVGVNTNSTTPIIGGELPLFDKTSYTGLDSIVFFCSGYNYANSGPAGSFVAELYDKTDGKIIGGSAITINAPAPQTVQYTPYFASGNILDSIPAKPVDLEILVSTSSTGNNGVAGQAFLLLRKK